MIFEVFRQERKGQAFAHAGSVEAPDDEFAEEYAREQFGRRGESVALWVVPRDACTRSTIRRRARAQLPPRRRLPAEGEAEGGDVSVPAQADSLLELADDELILGWRDSEWTGIAPVPRGGRRVLVDRAERDRPRAGALPAGRRGARHDRRRARVRPQAGGVPLLAVRRAAVRARLGADDRSPLPLRAGRRAADRGADGVRRRRGRRASPRRSTARRPTTACTPRCGSSGCRTSRATSRRSRSCGRSSTSATSHLPEFEQLWSEMTEVRRSVAGATW